MELQINLTSVLIALGLSFLFVIQALPRFIKVMLANNMVDDPGHRASHVVPTPTSGGITFLGGLLLSLVLLMDFDNAMLVIVFSMVLGLIGWWDDIKDISAILRLFFQLAMGLMLFLLGIRVDSLQGLLGIYELPIWVSLPFNMLLVAATINAFNLIDGVNGLAGGLTSIASIFFCLIFLHYQDYNFAIIAASLSGSLLGFLRYNFHKAKVFMGDAGSLIIGLCMSAFLLRCMSYQSDAGSTLSVSLIIVPFFDMIRVFLLRIISGKSPFQADKGHLHHHMLKLETSHRMTSMMLYFFQLGITMFALILGFLDIGFNLSVAMIIGNVIAFYALLDFRKWSKLRRKKAHLLHELSENENTNCLLNI